MPDSIVLLMSDSHGVYIPQFFIDDCSFWQGISDENRDILAKGPNDYENNPYYWEAWDSVLDSAFLVYKDITYKLYQDGDLWAISDNLTDQEHAEFFGECRQCGMPNCKGECMNDETEGE